MMIIGIMQPYLFPYIGYFQLIKAVDRFIAYDDVTFIKQGWINRNRILANGKPLLFSVPLRNASSNKLIRDVHIDNASYADWSKKYFKTLEQYYRKAPHYKNVLPVIMDAFSGERELISELSIRSIKTFCMFLDIKTEIIDTASHYRNNHLTAEDRVIDICHQEGAHIYVNASGGQELYSTDNFRRNEIELKFLKPGDICYKQFDCSFVPWLSIIDVLMFNAPETVQLFLNQYVLV
jgi:hypothetical protein